MPTQRPDCVRPWNLHCHLMWLRETVITAATDPANRFRMLYNFVCYSIAGVFLAIGGGYVFGGAHAASSQTLHLLLNIERSYRVHGAIMCLLGLGLVRGIPFTIWTRRVLLALLFYSLYTALMIVGGWFLESVSFGAPFWYLFVAVLVGGLLWFAPPLGPDGKVYRGPLDDA